MSGRWRVLSVAVAGFDHACRGEVCKDSIAVEQVHGAFVVAVAVALAVAVAVIDGGEGSQLSAAGARFAGVGR